MMHRRWWSDPVFHFILIGGLLVFVQALASPDRSQKALVVSRDVVRGLRADYARRTGTAPTSDEEAALVEDHVRNEILYREALALGLDKGDIVVRRRLIQKMQFLLEDETQLKEPADGDLTAYLRSHARRYGAPEKVAISHVFVSAERHAAPQVAALSLAGEIAAGRPAAQLGDPFLRGRELPLSSEATLGGIFGAAFAARVMTLPVGEWSAPIRSSYGYHLVVVRERELSHTASLDEVRARVLRDWRAEEREKANAKALLRLRGSYDVRIEEEGDA